MTLLPAVNFVHAEARAAGANEDSRQTLPTLVIRGGHAEKPLINDVRSVATLGGTDIEQLQIERIEDKAEYSAGILASSQTSGTETSLFIRGYRTDNSNVFVNGHQDNKRLFSRDLDTVEQADIIKGHSSVLFGSGSPGGTIHYQTRSPQPYHSTVLKAAIGSYQKRRAVLDSTGPTGISGLNYRFVAIGQQAGSFINNVGNDKAVLLGSLAWQYQENNQLRFEFEYDRLQNPYSYGIVRVNGKILYDKSYVDPRTKSDRRYWRGSVYWRHGLSDNWKLNALFNYSTLNRNDILMGFFYKLNENTLLGHWADSDNEFWQMNGKAELSGNIGLADMTHELSVGVEYNESDNDLDMLRSTAFTLDPYNPSFNRPAPRDSALKRGFHYRDKERSLYLVDRAQLSPRLTAVAGLRYSKFHNKNRLTNRVSVNQDAIASTLGLSWQFNQSATLYGSYVRSFEPNTGVSRNGDYFEPREAEQMEIGLRWQAGQYASLQMAVYDLTQKNLLTRDPDDRDFSIPAGQRRTRGFEIEALLDLDQDWQLQAAYSHLSNKVTKDFYGLLGNTASGIPRNMGSLRLQWQPGRLPGLHAYIGMIAVGKRYGDAANSFSVPGYGRADAGLSYQIGRITLRLTATNLFDKRYVAAPFNEDDLYQGKRRDITASIMYEW